MDQPISAPVFIIAGAALVVGLLIFGFGVLRLKSSNAYTSNLLAWALIALFPTLVIMNFFPDSTAEGSLLGWQLGGGAALYGALLVFGRWFGNKAIDDDRRYKERDERIAELEAMLAGAGTIDVQREERYALPGTGRELIVRTGNLSEIKDVKVWVSSENTNMQMARFYDGSVSAMIRYKGSRRDSSGHPVDDVIADELAAQSPAGTVVPTAVFSTTAGELLGTNNVERIYHVAAVQGVPGEGYRPVPNIRACVTAVLDQLDIDQPAFDTILFPLLGLGTAQGDDGIVHGLIEAAAAHPGTTATKVYFLARNLRGLRLCLAAADGLELQHLGGTDARALLT